MARYYKSKLVKTNSKGRYTLTTGGNKKYLEPGARTTSTKNPSSKKPSSKKPSTKKPSTKKPSPDYKPVKNYKLKQIGHRLSARSVYDKHGAKSIGMKFNILQPNQTFKLKVLRLDKNGRPFFSNKFGRHITFPLPSTRLAFGSAHIGHSCFG